MSALALGGLNGARAQESVPEPAPASANIKVHLSAAERQTFQSSLDALAAQSHSAIVAEGVPFHPTLPAGQTSRFSKETPLSVMLPALAAAYDYDVEYRNKVYLLRKKYSDIRDLPAVTLEECTQATQDILTVLRPFAINTEFPIRGMALVKVMPELAATLTPEQMQALHDRKLAVAALTPEQKAKVWQFVFYFYAQTPFEAAEEAAFDFKGAPRASVGVDPNGYTFSGASFHPFCYRTLSYEGKSVLRSFVRGGEIISISHGIGTTVGPALPPEEPEAPGAAPAPVTLAQEVAALNTRGLHATVDAALRVKPVSLAGDDSATPKQILQSLADIYGLRVMEPSGKDKTVQLTRPVFRVPLDAAALPECVWRVVPEPLQRAVHKGERDVIEREWQEVTPNGGAMEAMRRLDQRRNDDSELPKKLQAEAVRRLRLASDRYVRQQKQIKFLPVAAMAEPDRGAFGLVLMTDLLATVRAEYDRPAPGWITNFDQLVLRGGPFIQEDAESKWKFALNVAYPDASGTKLLDGPGAGGVAYFPPQ